MVIFFFPQRLLRFKIHLNIVLDLDEMRDLILVSTNITLQKGQKSTRKCLPMSDIATLSTGLPSVKEKNHFMEWCKLCGKGRNDSYYLRIDQLSSGKSKVTM